MADFDFDRMNELAATLARRTHEWPAIARAFMRDVTTFEWGLGKILDKLGVAARTFPSKLRIPGRLAIADDGKDGPNAEVYVDFLERGGTLIIEGPSRLEDLDIEAERSRLPAGSVVVEGDVGEFRTFWCDDEAMALAIEDAEILVSSSHGPMVSELSHRGGTVVVFSSQIAGFRRESSSKKMITARAVAKQLAIPVTETDVLDDSTKFPRDLFTSQLAMFGVLGGVIDRALG